MNNRFKEELDCCIHSLSEGIEEENSYWREPSKYEIDNNIDDIYNSLKLSEQKGNEVIKKWTSIYANKILEGIDREIKDNNNSDFSVVEIDDRKLRVDAVMEVAEHFRNVYLDGNKSIDKTVDVNLEWLTMWCIRKAKITLKKLEVDLLFKIADMLYNEEKL